MYRIEIRIHLQTEEYYLSSLSRPFQSKGVHDAASL
jgi:hypothetical protein